LEVKFREWLFAIRQETETDSNPAGQDMWLLVPHIPDDPQGPGRCQEAIFLSTSPPPEMHLLLVKGMKYPYNYFKKIIS
jgi:hypothetical protein